MDGPRGRRNREENYSDRRLIFDREQPVVRPAQNYSIQNGADYMERDLPEKERIVGESLIVTDMLQEFVYGKISSPRAKNVVEPIKDLLDAARTSKVPVIYVCDSHLPNDPEIRVWGNHAMKGSEGARIISDLSPKTVDYVLEKRVYSGFHETGLDLLLRDLNVSSVVIAGLLTEICVRHTTADAFMRGYRIRIPRDGVEAFSEEEQKRGLEYLKKVYGAEITNSSSIISDWKTG
jgi:nicotinamidase-related amidase